MAKMQEMTLYHGIQVNRTTVKENVDVYIDFPNTENREKLTPLLSNEEFAEHEVVQLKPKLPTISILDVKEFTSKEEFVEKIKQNKSIKMDGCRFRVNYSIFQNSR